MDSILVRKKPIANNRKDILLLTSLLHNSVTAFAGIGGFIFGCTYQIINVWQEALFLTF
jgi:hypothetical protein